MENEILQQILSEVKGIKTDIVEIKADIVEMKADIVEMKSDIVEMKSDMSEMRTDIDELKTSVDTLTNDVETLKVGQQVITRRIDKMDNDLAEIKENVVITRHSTNLLLSWSEKAENVVKVGLYE